jgi:ceramide glucosyltransferase
MNALIWAAGGFSAIALAAHLLSLLLGLPRSRAQAAALGVKDCPAITIVRPVCGLDNYAEETLGSTFSLDDPRCEIIFCAANPRDPVLPLVRDLIERHPRANARLLIGNDAVSENPKLNNLVKGWRTARYPWIALIDSNVMLPRDFVSRLFSAWRSETGLVSSPPLGAAPESAAAELECAFLNSYQARWQYTADAIGLGFAQGKLLFWQRNLLDRAGGIARLAQLPAEDAAATKIVRQAGLDVRLLAQPLPQPLGIRSWREVWHRQVRWARLRRATFPLYFAPEILSGAALPTLSAALFAHAQEISVPGVTSLFLLTWFGAEATFVKTAGWHFRSFSPLAWIARDALLPALWVQAWTSDAFVWRGHEMTAAASHDDLLPRGAGGDSRD